LKTRSVSDSEDEQPHGRNFKAVLADTVALHSEPSEKAKKRHVLRKKKKLTKSQLSEKRKLTQQRKLLGLVRPDVTTNREKERLLKKIATKGVVQLFNAVAERQRILAEELSKKMSAKQRRETEKRLDGPTAFHVYPENRKEDLKKRHVLRKKKKLTKSQLSEKRKLTQQRKLLGLVRPDVTTNREKERLLKKIATKGVVQLFNAVAERQRILAEELSKKMSAKQRRETEKRLDGPTAFHVYPENRKEDLKKETKEEEDDDDLVKTENEEE
ncbi:hypothetical protein COOONC_10574, partial [Cooperia oncophora]